MLELIDIDDGNSRSSSNPGFNDSVAIFELSESSAIGTKIGAVDSVQEKKIRESADQEGIPNEEDLDVSYKIVAGNSQGIFEIDRISSRLYLKKITDAN